MFVATHSLPVITESIRAGISTKIADWLKELDATSDQQARVTYTQPPMLSSQQTHGFLWGKKYDGWVDMLESDDKLVQVVLNVRYPKRRWFSKHKRDWNTLISTAEKLFGAGKSFDLGEKKGRLFKSKNVSALMTSYTSAKSAYIEIKIARGGFCS